MQVTANGSVNWFAATASRGRSTCRIAWSTLSDEAVLAGSGGRQAPDLAHEPIERCLDIVLREGRRYMAAFKLVDVEADLLDPLRRRRNPPRRSRGCPPALNRRCPGRNASDGAGHAGAAGSSDPPSWEGAFQRARGPVAARNGTAGPRSPSSPFAAAVVHGQERCSRPPPICATHSVNSRTRDERRD